MPHSFFANRIAILASMHRKEKVIAPILEPELGIQLVVPEAFDTDQFGTFTRDRDRPGTQLAAAQLKARKALELTGETLAIASEGTFAPHPGFPAIPCNRELVLLLDTMHGLEIVGEELSIETNYKYRTIRSFEQALKFTEEIGFPSHGVVVMVSQASREPEEICKGITDLQRLQASVEQALKRSPDGTIHIETDMRALYNPTRLATIEKATINLLSTILNACPVCATPGFKLVERRVGLPCELCSLPTALTRIAVYRCQTCDFIQDVEFPNGVKTADPVHCNFCNP